MLNKIRKRNKLKCKNIINILLILLLTLKQLHGILKLDLIMIEVKSITVHVKLYILWVNRLLCLHRCIALG